MFARLSDAEIERHIPALRRFAWSLARDRDRADDLVQDTLLKAVSRWAQLRRPESARPWLMQILYNTFRQDLRRCRGEGVPVPADTHPDHPAGTWYPDDRLTLINAMDALTRLPDEQRAVLELVAIEELTYEEVSQVMGLPIGTVMSRLSRARERLRGLLDDHAPAQLRRVK
jgi:RNA polymerase sigma-70 factor (ECF subfamily)